MCGIAGLFTHDAGATIDHSVLTRMRDAMRHRGPDGAGIWNDDGVGLAHRRLSVIDVEGSPQPMHSGDGRAVITFNGEIYNYRELRSELAALGHRFRTQGDTEVILAAWRQWGTDCLQRFNGMFAFALWDQPNESLVKLPETAFQEPSESLSANQASIATALMFYSNVDNRLRSEFNNVVAAYVDGATSYTGEPIHNNHGQWNTYLQRSDHQQMERVNYKALRRLFAGTWEQVKLAPDKEEDVAVVESAGIPGIAALQAGIKAKEGGTKTKADATKKEKTSNNTVFLLLAAGAAVAYAAS